MGRGPGGPGPAPQKPLHAKRTMTRLLAYLRQDIPLMLMVLFFILLSSGAQLAATWMLTPIFDTISEGNGLAKAALYLVLLAVIYLVGVAATWIQSRTMIKISQHMVLRMRKDLYDHVMRLPIRFFDAQAHGDIMSRFSNDMDIVSETLNNASVQVVSSVISLIGTLVSMLILSPLLTLLTMILFPVMILISRFFMKHSHRYFSQQQKALGDLNGFMEETAEGQKVVKIFCYEDQVEEDFDRLNEEFRQKATKAQIVSGIIHPLMQHISTFNYVLVATIGGALALQGIFSLGNIATFLNLSRQFGQPVTQIANQLSMIQSALAGAERVFDVMDRQPEPAPQPGDVRLQKENGALFWVNPGGLRVAVKGDVRLEHVTFGYLPDKVVLHDVSLYAKPGQKIAFVGSTGAGKTTITNLLTRFYDIQEGRITIDGIDIRDMALPDLRRSLAMVLQDTHLFTGTVRDNIRYGRLEATDEECEQAARLASAHSFITRLPHGYDTLLDGDGGNLSQGQRQLLNIARAAVADPAILILDEATSSVDTRTEKLIERGMDRLMENRTTFVIAHRLSTVRDSNAIMVIEHGSILERGDHEDLLRQKGRYYQLYTGQFELE